MKRSVWIVLLCVLLGVAACAGASDGVPLTKHETVTVEGVEREVLFTYFSSSLGYSLWYDAEYFRVIPAGEDQRNDRIVPAAYDAAESVSMEVSLSQGMSLDAAAATVREIMESAEFEIKEIDTQAYYAYQEWVGFSGVRGSVRRVCYCVAAEDTVLTLVMEYPEAEEERLGSRMVEMVKTVRIPEELPWSHAE